MSRIRTIKPEFWTNERVVECSTNARLLFVGLWNFCDDCGNHPLSEKTVKGSIFPCDNFTTDDIRRMLDELSTNGLIEFYSFENKGYLNVIGWEHQKIDRPQKPRYPSKFDERSTIIRRTLDERSGTESITEPITEKNIDFSLKNLTPNSPKRIVVLPLKNEFDDIFWPANPNKIGKAAAWKSFAAARKRCELEPMMAGLAAYVRDKPPDRPWCNPATWLNQDRWLDQPARASPPPNGHDPHPPLTQTRIFVSEDTPQWNSWNDFWKKTKGVTCNKTFNRKTKTHGWWFPTAYPDGPEHVGRENKE